MLVFRKSVQLQHMIIISIVSYVEIGKGGVSLISRYGSCQFQINPVFCPQCGISALECFRFMLFHPQKLCGLAAGIDASILALLVGIPTIRLREDYLGIATIGIAEIIRLVIKNEAWLTNGVRGVSAIPKPLAGIFGSNYNLFFLLIVAAVIAIFYYLSEKGINSPWGRVLRAIREDEEVVKAAGKNVVRYRMEAFILGAFMMGVGGALYAHFTSFISPEAFRPMQATFLVWIMLIIGGSANNFGSLVGALLTWGIWTGTEFLTGMLPAAYTTQAAAVRVILIGIFLEVILLSRPQGLFGEKKYSSKSAANS